MPAPVIRGVAPCATRKPDSAGRTAALALVHHANQPLITVGYANRVGVDDLVGSRGSENGYLKVLELHHAYRVPLHLHLSGTLLESCLWHRPDFLDVVRALVAEGLVELVGSAYGQNVMRFFSDEYNARQLREQLELYGLHLGVDPRDVRVFLPPERIWDTTRMASVLTDESLPNGGYRAVLLDDRLLYPVEKGPILRRAFDEAHGGRPEDFQAWEIREGRGLLALPIARELRANVPPHGPSGFAKLEERFASLASATGPAGCIGIHVGDIEAVAGVGSFEGDGLARYEELLKWLADRAPARVVKLSEWLEKAQPAGQRPIDVGSRREMSHEFGAGDGMENWYFDPHWRVYREQQAAAEERVVALDRDGADPRLIALAWKQLLVSGWQTAWQTPTSGPYGDPTATGEPSRAVRAIATHCRLARVIAEAAHWMTHRDGDSHAELVDLDLDGEAELVLKNDRIFAVFTPRWGGRLVSLFDLTGDDGMLVVGNPADDWNGKETLNRYVDAPANHPGALSELGQIDDRHEVRIESAGGEVARVLLVNEEPGSCAAGTHRRLTLPREGCEIEAVYELSETRDWPTLECGMSPDYFALLRRGRRAFAFHEAITALGCSNGEAAVWVRLETGYASVFGGAVQREFSHGKAFRFAAPAERFRLWIGTGPFASSPLRDPGSRPGKG